MSSNCWESRARARAHTRLQGALFLLVKYRCKLELAHNEARFNNAFDLNQDVMKIITSQRRTTRINGRVSLYLLVTIVLVVRAFNAQPRNRRLQWRIYRKYSQNMQKRRTEYIEASRETFVPATIALFHRKTNIESADRLLAKQFIVLRQMTGNVIRIFWAFHLSSLENVEIIRALPALFFVSCI